MDYFYLFIYLQAKFQITYNKLFDLYLFTFNFIFKKFLFYLFLLKEVTK